MQQNSIFIIPLILIGVFLSRCNEKNDECICQINELCIYDSYSGKNECYLNESVHYLGGSRIIVPNSYVGIVENNSCIDTLIFYNDTTRALNDERFGLIVNVSSFVQNVIGSNPTFQAGNNEYFLTTVEPVCYLNGEGQYSDIHCIIFPDSVWMELKFWTLETKPGLFIDSTVLMLYKKH
jgi:hypothetical protein